MKLLAFRNGLKPMFAHRIVRNDVSHFNLQHGTRLAAGWEVSMGVDDKIVSKELENNEYDVEMSANDYILLPIYKTGTTNTIVDARGNQKFFISKDFTSNKNTALLFLYLPPYDDVSYELYGPARVISIGSEVVYKKKGADVVIDAPVVLFDDDSAIIIRYLLDDVPTIERIIFKNNELQHITEG